MLETKEINILSAEIQCPFLELVLKFEMKPHFRMLPKAKLNEVRSDAKIQLIYASHPHLHDSNELSSIQP